MKRYDHGICTLCRTCGCCAGKEREIQKLEDKLEAALAECARLREQLPSRSKPEENKQ